MVARTTATPDSVASATREPAAIIARHDAALSGGLRQLTNDTGTVGLISAVSGGADSIALALLADRFANLHAHRHSFRHQAIIINHCLRPEAADEAANARAVLARLGIPAEIQTLTANPPTSGIQSWARAERYRLLCAAARDQGAVLLTGHHADDQIETVSMRLQRGSGLGGLAGIRALSFREGVAVLRPLLGLSHDQLVDLCHHHEVAFASDPSNADRRFERVRVRRELAAMRSAGMAAPDQLARLAHAAAALDDGLHAALEDAGCRPQIHPAGYADIPPALLTWPESVSHRVLSQLAGIIGNGQTPPSMAATSRLVNRMAAGRPATLGGCRFVTGPAGWLAVAEPGRTPPVQPITRDRPVIFAGRWRISSPQDGVVRFLGSAGSGASRAWRDAAGWCALASPIRRALPVIETLDGDLLYPHLHSVGFSSDRKADRVADRMAKRPAGATAEFLPYQTGFWSASPVR